jgi:phosphoribosyl-ATP pyrophosphohydrolase
MAGAGILERLGAVIEQRRRERPDDSYVVQLLDGGHAAIAAKLREESEELIAAAAGDDAAHTAHEAADLLFHTFVLLAHAGVDAEAVYAQLEARFGTGGLAEKRSRQQDGKGETC